jgi:uracil-DNA glycosylase
MKVNTKICLRMKNLIKLYKESGVTELLYRVPANRTVRKVVNEVKLQPSLSAVRLAANQCNSLEDLKAALAAFTECKLKDTAINTVIGEGNPNADIMLIGEAPGRQEDEQGIPFCGQSGKLLNNIMLAIGYKREDLYITNSVFWRPPANRRPTPEEIELCRPFVEKHIALVKPKIIIMVGSTAAEALLDSADPMNSLRKKGFVYSNEYLSNPITAFVIFHPAYLLRQPKKKKDMWQDMQYIKRYLDSHGKSSNV